MQRFLLLLFPAVLFSWLAAWSVGWLAVAYANRVGGVGGG